jgi:hypothetical protein
MCETDVVGTYGPPIEADAKYEGKCGVMEKRAKSVFASVGGEQ